ncbi:MAG TPA: hypothetical protein VKD71_11955, partial [Gemmataceae bacterium]|nr:hypothetical protein [Gemmataceae bacterium]
FQDPGTFWHVAVGNRIIEEGFFDTDPYTFTFAGKKWIPHQWLGECVMAVVYRISDFDGLLLGTATLLAAVYAGLGIRLMRNGLHPSASAVLVAAAVAASSGHFHVRPHLATIVGMAVVMVFLTDVENGRIPIHRLAWLIPVVWLWSNFHGGVLGALATMALAIGGWGAFRLMRRESPIATWRDFGWIGGIWLACAAVCFANPYFYRLPWSWVEIYEMSSLPSIIKEHSRVNPGEWAGLAIIGFGVLYIVLLLSVPVRRFRVVWLLPVVWFVLACLRVRHAPLFAVGALVGIADFFPLSGAAAALIRRKSDLFTPVPAGETELTVRENASPFAIPAALVLLAVLFQVSGLAVPVLGRDWARLDSTIWPLNLLPKLKEHQYDRPRGTRIFCEYPYGGFLIHFCPGYRVFIDDRCELFGDQFLTEFVLTKELLHADAYENPAEPFADWQYQYGSFDLALVESGGGFDHALAQIPAWEVVRQMDRATLYRKTPDAK